jgi:AraC-like DNA-binding protein
MGLPVSIHLRGDRLTAQDVEQRIAAVFTALRRVDAVLSPYRDGSDLSAWERGALRLADADPMLAQVVALCDEARQRTEGWFDPRGLPDPRTGEPRYDPSGLVKGWAVERAARHLSTLDSYGWCLNAGGDVLVHAPADQPAWRIGIEHWTSRPASCGSSNAALGDPAITAALRTIHQEPARQLTVEALGTKAGLSRAAFSRRFTSLVGKAPLGYLTWWRMTLAVQLLRDSDKPVQTVAQRAGYTSEFAFTKAFKREHGVAPGRYRRRSRT